MAGKARRTTHRSTTGTKLYAVSTPRAASRTSRPTSAPTGGHQAEGYAGKVASPRLPPSNGPTVAVRWPWLGASRRLTAPADERHTDSRHRFTSCLHRTPPKGYGVHKTGSTPERPLRQPTTILCDDSVDLRASGTLALRMALG
jgi:hypothetical protein